MHPKKKLMQGQTVKYQTEILMSLQRPLAVCLFAVFADLIHFFGSFFTHCMVALKLKSREKNSWAPLFDILL